MTEEQAKARCARLAATHPDRETHQWLPRQVGEEWQVVKIGVPPPVDPLRAETRADERPAQGEDQRPAAWRDVPPFGGGV